jgi:hypothetical protein
MFNSPLFATWFAAAAGPMAWDDKQHRQRDRETPGHREPWRWSWWQWRLWGDTVYFPTRDIDRAEATLRRLGSTGLERIGAATGESEAHLSAPRLCPVCGRGVVGRRADARYCSRRCQLASRKMNKERV